MFLATTPLIAEDNLSAGSFTVVFSSMLAMMRPLKSLTNVNSQFQRGMAACQTLFAILDLEPEKITALIKQNLLKVRWNLKCEFCISGKRGTCIK